MASMSYNGSSETSDKMYTGINSTNGSHKNYHGDTTVMGLTAGKCPQLS